MLKTRAYNFLICTANLWLLQTGSRKRVVVYWLMSASASPPLPPPPIYGPLSLPHPPIYSSRAPYGSVVKYYRDYVNAQY